MGKCFAMNMAGKFNLNKNRLHTSNTTDMKNTKSKFPTREQWLEAAVGLMAPHFRRNGYKDFPKVRVSCGWPSSRGLGGKKIAVGECWDKSSAEDSIAQIFVSPRIKKYSDVLPVLAHEVVHAVVGNTAKHGKVFKKCALAIGLEGKMTATIPGERFLAEAKHWVEQSLGEYPHSQLNPKGRPTKKQTTRMVKCECEACGYSLRTSRKWLDAAGAPLCPCNEQPMKYEIPDELAGEEGEAE